MSHIVVPLPTLLSEVVLTRAEADALSCIQDILRSFDAAMTGGGLRLREVRKLEELGLVKSVGLCSQCDGDGGIIETRNEREGWILTEKGKAALESIQSSADRFAHNLALEVKLAESDT